MPLGKLPAGLAFGLLAARTPSAQDLVLESHPTRWRLSIERFEADDDNELGVFGLHFDTLELWPERVPGLYGGVGGYGAVTGSTGGLFYGGLTLGWLREMYPGWNLDVGLMAGAGGGGGADTGTGLLLRPHIAFERVLGMTAVRLELAQVDFVNGEIEDMHLALGVSLPGEILTAELGSPRVYVPESELLWRRLRIVPIATRFYPKSGTETTAGQPNDSVVELAGFEADYFFGEHAYLPFLIEAAVGGDVGGFLAAMTGIGGSWPSDVPGIAVEGQLLVGGGGGGDADTGGGFLWNARGGFSFALPQHWALELLGGYRGAPDGDFDGWAASFGVAWSPRTIELRYDYPRARLNEEGLPSSVAALDVLRLQVLHKSYFPTDDDQKTNGGEISDSIHLIGIGVQKPVEILHQDFALTASAAGAWDGNVGGYAEGLVGLQYELAPFAGARFHTMTARAEAGAVGGGDVDTGPGLIYALSLGWRFQYNRDLALSLDVGSVEADRGAFHAETFTVGLGYGFDRPVFR